MTIRLHEGDLPADFDPGTSVAIDTETLGLRLNRDRLCLVQVSRGDGDAELVRIAATPEPAPNLLRILADPEITKIFHFARFDLAALCRTFGVMAAPVYCTKVAAVLARTYAERHSLRDLCAEYLDIKLSKQEQRTDWGGSLTEAQMTYAALDVLNLHELRTALDAVLVREGRDQYAARCFAFLPWRAELDLAGWDRIDIFAHNATADS